MSARYMSDDLGHAYNRLHTATGVDVTESRWGVFNLTDTQLTTIYDGIDTYITDVRHTGNMPPRITHWIGCLQALHAFLKQMQYERTPNQRLFLQPRNTWNAYMAHIKKLN